MGDADRVILSPVPKPELRNEKKLIQILATQSRQWNPRTHHLSKPAVVCSAPLHTPCKTEVR